MQIKRSPGGWGHVRVSPVWGQGGFVRRIEVIVKMQLKISSRGGQVRVGPVGRQGGCVRKIKAIVKKEIKRRGPGAESGLVWSGWMVILRWAPDVTGSLDKANICNRQFESAFDREPDTEIPSKGTSPFTPMGVKGS